MPERNLSGRTHLTRRKSNRPHLPPSKAKLLFALAVALLMFVLLIVQLFTVSIIRGEYWTKKAMAQWARTTYLKAERGRITDRDGTVLASSYTTYQVCVNPQNIQVDDRERIATILSTYLDMDYDTVLAKMSKVRIITDRDGNKTQKPLSQVKIKDQVDKETISQLNAMQLGTGVSYYADVKRDYPESGYYAQLLGFTNVDGDGQTGVELTYNKYLAGTDGFMRTDTDRDNNPIPGGEEEYILPVAGGSVTLTTNTGLQAILENALQEACTVNSAKTAYGILLSPKTGEIFAEGSYPTFDSSDPPRSDAKLLLELSRNRVVTDTYEPGSTFKVVTLAAALDSGAVTEQTGFNCKGSLLVKGEKIKCWNSRGHGQQTLSDAVANSCNPAFMSMALKMGLNKFYEYIYAFGFNEPTGSGIMGETSGTVLHKKYVRDGDLARIGFGQSISCTGMQLAMAFTAAINGGELLKPYIVSDIIDNDGNVLLHNERTVVARVISPQTSATVRSMLQNVVERGSGRNAQVYGYTVGGKTGTSQKYEEDGSVSSRRLIASFIGFAPVSDPQFVCLVVVDEPNVPQVYGSTVAAPFVQQILSASLSLTGVPSDSGNLSATVPQVVGMTVREAVSVLKDYGLNATYLETELDSLVTAQAPRSNVTVVTGSNVILYSNGYTFFNETDEESVETVKMPELVGKKIDRLAALDKLNEVGLIMDYDPAQSAGYVSYQAYPEGTELPKGSVVHIEFSTDG